MDTADIVGVLLLLLGTGIAYYLLQRRTHKHQRVPIAGRSEVEEEFKRVFFMTSTQGKEGLIQRWMDRTGCDRTEAMRLATEEWRRDNR